MPNNTKIIITGITNNNIDALLNNIVHNDDNLNIIPTFTTNKDEISFYNKYLDVITVNLSYKNNSLLYISTVNYISSGITIDDFINNDICYIDLKNFNTIPDKIFNEFDILVIWLDSKHVNLTNIDKIESKHFMERIYNLKYMYFLDDNEEDICNTIFQYLNGTDDEKINILNENS